MPTKVEMLRCNECGHTLTREEFERILCDGDHWMGQEHFENMLEYPKCLECDGSLEEGRDG